MLALDFFCDKHWFYCQEQPLAFFSNICRLCGDGSESCRTRHCFTIRFASFTFPLPFMCRCCLSEQKQKETLVVIKKNTCCSQSWCQGWCRTSQECWSRSRSGRRLFWSRWEGQNPRRFPQPGSRSWEYFEGFRWDFLFRLHQNHHLLLKYLSPLLVCRSRQAGSISWEAFPGCPYSPNHKKK